MDLIQTQRATVAEHILLENGPKWSEVPRTLVQDRRAFYNFVSVRQFQGIEGPQQLYQMIVSAFSNLRIDISAAHDMPGCSIREGVITGTYTGEYLGVPASGNPARIAFAAFIVFAKILAECWANAFTWITERSCCKEGMSQRLAK
jgi:hypothetical protein